MLSPFCGTRGDIRKGVSRLITGMGKRAVSGVSSFTSG